MFSEETRQTAAQCRHYAMCKIDFLDTGICASGRENHYVSHFPQGRMDLYDALALLQRSGLTKAACQRLSNGLAVLYSGEKA